VYFYLSQFEGFGFSLMKVDAMDFFDIYLFPSYFYNAI